MDKKTLIDKVAEKTGKKKKDIAEIINHTLGVIGDAMKEEEPVQLIGFGTFTVKERAERTCRNPKTGEMMVSPAKKTVSFKASRGIYEFSFNL